MNTLLIQFTGEFAFPSRESCGEGYKLAITVYFPGTPDAVRDGFGVSTGNGETDQRGFLNDLKAELENQSAACCIQLGFEVIREVLMGPGRSFANM